MRQTILQKYGGLVFDDVDNNMIRKTIVKHMVEWVRGGGWHVVAESPEYYGTNKKELEHIQISHNLFIILLPETIQPAVLNMRYVRKKNNEDGSDDNTDNDTNDDINDNTDENTDNKQSSGK